MYVLFFLSDGSACGCWSLVIVKAIEEALTKISVITINERIMETPKPINDELKFTYYWNLKTRVQNVFPFECSDQFIRDKRATTLRLTISAPPDYPAYPSQE